MTHPETENINRSHLKILLVDDDEFLLDLMRESLLGLGVGSVDIARNGLEGLGFYKRTQDKPNVVICDLCMPQLGGMEFLSHLAREGCKADVLIISGHNHVPPKNTHWNLAYYNGPVLNLAEKLARIQGLNVKATFEKPITHEKLMDMMQLLEHKNAPAQQQDKA